MYTIVCSIETSRNNTTTQYVIEVFSRGVDPSSKKGFKSLFSFSTLFPTFLVILHSIIIIFYYSSSRRKKKTTDSFIHSFIQL